MKSLAPLVEVVAVQPAGAPAMALSWRRGSVVQTDTIDTIADGVAGRCPITEVLEDLLVVVDDVVLVGEESIKCDYELGLESRLSRVTGTLVDQLGRHARRPVRILLGASGRMHAAFVCRSVPSHPVRLGSIEIIACAPHRVGWDHPNVAGHEPVASSSQE